LDTLGVDDLTVDLLGIVILGDDGIGGKLMEIFGFFGMDGMIMSLDI
jgi:hypothetical protein